MRRLSAILVYLTLALWLPATQHCVLEAASLLTETCNDGCEAGQDGKKDACGTVESGAYKLAASTVSAPAPDRVAGAGHVCFFWVQSDAARALAAVPGLAVDGPRDWVTTWHFARRAAPPARAPDALNA